VNISKFSCNESKNILSLDPLTLSLSHEGRGNLLTRKYEFFRIRFES
jgi:hypothetical protein